MQIGEYQNVNFASVAGIPDIDALIMLHSRLVGQTSGAHTMFVTVTISFHHTSPHSPYKENILQRSFEVLLSLLCGIGY